MWLGVLQKSLDSEASELQACSLRAFWDRGLTGNEVWPGPLQKSLDSEASELLDSETSEPQVCSLTDASELRACSLRALLDRELTGN